jgi:4-oxalocrotonate tautomerase
MPIVNIHLLKGRDKEKKKELIRNVTDAVTGTLEVPGESVRVILSEIENEDYGAAGLPIMEYRLKKAEEKKKEKSD